MARQAVSNRVAASGRYMSTGWIPSDSGAVLTLSPATLTSGTLTTWSDTYGGANSATQGTAANRPTIVQDSRGAGRHGVLFDGTNDLLAGAFTLNQPCTIGILYKSIVVGALVTHDIIFDGFTSNGQQAAMVSPNDLPNVIFNFGSSQNTSVGTPTADNVYERWIVVANGATSLVYRNGNPVFSGNLGTNNPGGLTIAALRNATRHTNIEVGAMVAIPSALNGATREALDKWLAIQ